LHLTLEGFLLKFFYESIYLVQFFGDIYPLRTMMVALLASNAMVGLAQLGYTTVISNQESTSCLAVVFVLTAFRHITFVHTLVVMKKYRRYVYAVWTWHAILTIVTRDSGILLYEFGGIEKELCFILCQWYKW
jgi:hypothetical protein